MFYKKIDAGSDIHELIARRWSGRAYDPDRLLGREQIMSLIEAARWAPSCFGDQPWRFIVFDRSHDKVAWSKALDCVSEGNRGWAQNVPVLFLNCADSIMTETGKANRWGQYDSGAAAENLCLQATAMGLMAHQMGGFDTDRARNFFHIPERFTPMAMISVGYQLPEEAISADMREREYQARLRDPVDQHFFSGDWGKPIIT